MRKGEQTRTLILNEAVGLASHVGLEGLSIGLLASNGWTCRRAAYSRTSVPRKTCSF